MQNLREIRLVISGQVQGVGFRATTQQHAKKIGLTGIVRNLSDGTVEIIAQGTANQLSQLLKAIHTSFPSHISAIQKTEKIPEKKYDCFEIKS